MLSGTESSFIHRTSSISIVAHPLVTDNRSCSTSLKTTFASYKPTKMPSIGSISAAVFLLSAFSSAQNDAIDLVAVSFFSSSSYTLIVVVLTRLL